MNLRQLLNVTYEFFVTNLDDQQRAQFDAQLDGSAYDVPAARPVEVPKSENVQGLMAAFRMKR